jgi:hypothetical protein
MRRSLSGSALGGCRDQACKETLQKRTCGLKTALGRFIGAAVNFRFVIAAPKAEHGAAIRVAAVRVRGGNRRPPSFGPLAPYPASEDRGTTITAPSGMPIERGTRKMVPAPGTSLAAGGKPSRVKSPGAFCSETAGGEED